MRAARLAERAQHVPRHARKQSEKVMKFMAEEQKVIEEWPALVLSTEAASGATAGRTLLPMPIAGLSLIVLGGAAVMIFV